MFSWRTMLPHVANALAWASLLTWPWTAIFHALVVLAVLHVVMPFWSVWIDRPAALHRKFATGPLLMFATDVGFLIAAFKQDIWFDLTSVFVPILAVVAVIALAGSAAIMTLLTRTRARRGTQ